MPIITSELILYGAANRPDDESSTVGGAIDVAARPLDSDVGSLTDIEAVSDGADTRTLTIVYRDETGEVLTDDIVLNGTTPVPLGDDVERILSATLSDTDNARTVILREESAGATIHTFNPDETDAFRLFRQAASDDSAKVYYEKVFWANTHDSLSLLNAIVDLVADPAAKIEIGLAATADDTGTAADRLTAPGGVTFQDDDTDIAVPGTNLAAGAAIGVWIKLSLEANDNALKSTFTTRLRGESV